MRNTRLKWGDRPFKWMDAGECSIDRLLGSKWNNSQVDVRRWLFIVLFKVISYFPSGKSTIWGIYRACGLWPAQAAPSRSVPEGDFLCFKTSFPMEQWWCFNQKTSSKATWNCGMEVDGFPKQTFQSTSLVSTFSMCFAVLNPAEIHCANLPSSIHRKDGDCWRSSASQWKPQKVAGNSPVVDDFPSYKL